MVATVAWVLVGVLVALQWYAVWSAREGLETWTKPLATASVLVAAGAAGLFARDGGIVAAIGLLFGLLGDVLLLQDTDSRFLAGLASFLGGHLLYIAAFVVRGLSPNPWLVVTTVTVVVALGATRQVLPSVWRNRSPGFAGAVAAYMLVLTVCALAAGATGCAPLAVGGAVFVVSDAVLAQRTFVRRQAYSDLVVSVTYLLAQILIVGGFTRP